MHVSACVKLLKTFSILVYIMCIMLCFFYALSRGVGALQISNIIIIVTDDVNQKSGARPLTPLIYRGQGHWRPPFIESKVTSVPHLSGARSLTKDVSQKSGQGHSRVLCPSRDKRIWKP